MTMMKIMMFMSSCVHAHHNSDCKVGILMMMTMIRMMIIMMMVTTVFVGSRSLERILLWCFREKSVTWNSCDLSSLSRSKMVRPGHTGTASNPKLPTRSCQCDGWTMWCWELRGMSLTSFWHPCNSARRWTSICHFDVPPKNACLSQSFMFFHGVVYFVVLYCMFTLVYDEILDLGCLHSGQTHVVGLERVLPTEFQSVPVQLFSNVAILEPSRST